VTHPDFERRVVAGVDLVPSAPKPLSLDVVLSPGFGLAGVVKDKEGKPVEGAEVTLSQSVMMTGGRGGNMVSFNSVQSARPRGETDFEGRFGFKGLSAGEYDVTVSKPGYTRSISNGVKAGEGAAALEVVLSPGASIAGRLVQPNGQPVTGYSVTARPSSAGSSSAMILGPRANNFAQVDPDGGFLLEGLTPGTAYDLSIFGAGEFRGDPKKKGVVAPAADVEIEVPSRGRIAGRVLDAASGAPVTDFEASYTPARSGGIVIRMGPAGENDRRTPFSSPEGAFSFEDVPPGNFDVTVWAKTYQEARTGGVAVVAGETRNIEVKAARGLVIRGRVVDAKSGRGVQDASVSARAGGSGGAFMFNLGENGGGVITDADGRFEIVDQGPGSYQLTARHSLFSEATARVTLEDKDGVVDIPMVSGGVIAGMVASSQGAPLAGAEVSLQNNGDAGGIRMGMEGQGTLTDGAGRFRFEHLAAGRYKVGATLRSEASPTIDVPLNAGDVREDIRLALDAGATVRGVVKGLSESERSGVMIGAQGSEDYFANTRTNADGSFEFTGVPKGSLTLRATAGDLVFGSSHTATREVAIPAGQSEVLTEIVFDDGLTISGTVTRRGAPVSGARVSAYMSGTGRQGSGRTDESGAFRISGLETGRVNVTAFAESFSSQATQIVELKADMSVDLVIPTAKLSGMVLDSASGLPLESTVELQRTVPGPAGSGGQMRMSATTDSSGRFGFDDLEPVDYRLTARRSGYESVAQTIKPSESGEDLRLELKRGSGLSVEAKDAQMGFGLRGLFVRVQDGTQDAFSGSVTLDGEGKGEIPGIPPGTYTVTAQASGYAPVRVPNVMAPLMVLRLAFTPGGAVEFRTTEEFLKDGLKSGQLVSLSGAPLGMGQGGPNSFRLARLTQRMENLTPGRYRLSLDGGIDKTFDVTEGGVAIVTIP
jgi:protocatechuate 3,4-dioxygenase beta subunit